MHYGYRRATKFLKEKKRGGGGISLASPMPSCFHPQVMLKEGEVQVSALCFQVRSKRRKNTFKLKSLNDMRLFKAVMHVTI